jgi:antitoxin HicB
MEKDIEYYLNLPYTYEMILDPDHAWFIRVKELPGCMSQGDTPEEAIEMIRDAMRGWIGVALEDGIPVPEPRPEEDYSGKFVVRVPRSLHRQLAEVAEREGVSLNQFINVALGMAVGRANASTSVTYPIGERQQQMAVREKKTRKSE